MNSKVVNPLEWNEGKLKLIDQRYIPLREEYVTVSNISECHEAVRVMVVRGAPLIGFTAIWGMVLWLRNHPGGSLDEFIKAGEFLITAGATAVNLEFEVHRSINMATKWSEENGSLEGFVSELENLGNAQYEELEKKNLTMAKLASEELTGLYGSRKLRLMTLCNTGRLACGPLGTALGVISYMASNGRVEIAYPSETRPYLQGSRLTAYEMLKEGIPHKIVVEGAASWLMREGKIDAIFIGADRIASNGDTANKIGSSSLAIIAKHYGVPFYVVAPLSSFDLNIESGKEIEIELRPEDEILSLRGQPVAPDGSHALNPSFDITTNDLITGIFCEKGIVKPVNRENLLKIAKS